MNNKRKLLIMLIIFIISILIYMFVNGYLATIVLTIGCITMFFDETLPTVRHGLLLGVLFVCIMICLTIIRSAL